MIFKRKKQNKKNIINLIASSTLLIFGIALLIFPRFGINNPINIMYIAFAVYALVKLIEYFLTKNGSDFENLYSSIASAIAALSGFRFASYENIPLVLSLTLITWIFIMAIIKLIKLDYYHDRENGMVYVNLVTFTLFILIGILTSINLYFEQTVQSLMLGFFFLINGVLSLAENAIRILVTHNNVKIKDINK